MRRNLVLSLTALLALGVVTGPLFFGLAPRAQAGIHAPPKFYPNRWVFVFLSLQGDTYVEQIRQIARTASAHGLNGMLLSGSQARLRPDPPVAFANGDFEQYTGNQFPSYRFHDRPGEITFADSAVFHGGRASMRFENFGSFETGNGRVMQEIAVQPHRCYRATV